MTAEQDPKEFIKLDTQKETHGIIRAYCKKIFDTIVKTDLSRSHQIRFPISVSGNSQSVVVTLMPEEVREKKAAGTGRIMYVEITREALDRIKGEIDKASQQIVESGTMRTLDKLTQSTPKLSSQPVVLPSSNPRRR